VSSNTLLAETVRYCDQAAFAALFRSHYGRVYQVLYRLVGDEADDLAQEAFLRLYERWPRLSGADVGAWLYRVATRLGYNALRAARRRDQHRDALGHAQQRVRRALGTLSGCQARLLALRSSGLSYREIAAALQVAPGSVGTLLARAERAFERAYRSLLGDEAETRDEP
jgi:RNA polymerase sigma-70 factor (ECF subfamily)